MTYFQMGDDHLARLEESGLSNDAILLEVQAFNHAAKSSSDGYIRTRLAKLIDSPDPALLAAELVAQGFWEVTDDGYYCVNYLQHNLSADMVDMAREGARERKERSRRHKLGDHSMCIVGRYCPDGQVEPNTRSKDSHVTRDGTRDGTHDRTLRQDNTKQDNSRSVSIGSKDGATPNAPNGALVVAPEMIEWPHPHLITKSSPKCRICDKEKSAKHFDADKADYYIQLVESLLKEGFEVTLENSINTTLKEHWYEIYARKPSLGLHFECSAADLEKTLDKKITIDYMGADRVISAECAKLFYKNDLEPYELNPFPQWYSPIEKFAATIDNLDLKEEQEFCIYLSEIRPLGYMGADKTHIKLSVGSSDRRKNRIGRNYYELMKLLKLFEQLPEPDLSAPTEIRKPTESNEMEKQQ